MCVYKYIKGLFFDAWQFLTVLLNIVFKIVVGKLEWIDLNNFSICPDLNNFSVCPGWCLFSKPSYALYLIYIWNEIIMCS